MFLYTWRRFVAYVFFINHRRAWLQCLARAVNFALNILQLASYVSYGPCNHLHRVIWRLVERFSCRSHYGGIVWSVWLVSSVKSFSSLSGIIAIFSHRSGAIHYTARALHNTVYLNITRSMWITTHLSYWPCAIKNTNVYVNVTRCTHRQAGRSSSTSTLGMIGSRSTTAIIITYRW